MMREWVASAVVALLLTGCSGLEPKSRREMENRIYDQPYELVYAAVRAVLVERGYPITEADRALGLLETDWLVGKYNRTRARAEVMSLARQRNQVRLGIKLEEKGLLGGKWKPKPVKMSTYEDFFEDIEVQIYREYFHKIERPARQKLPKK